MAVVQGKAIRLDTGTAPGGERICGIVFCDLEGERVAVGVVTQQQAREIGTKLLEFARTGWATPQ